MYMYCSVPSLYLCLLVEISLILIQWQIQHDFLFNKIFKVCVFFFFNYYYITQQMH